jgi:hypothetical protein
MISMGLVLIAFACLFPQAIPQLEVEEEWRIDGTLPELNLNPIRHLIVTSTGDLLLSQASEPSIILVSKKGELLARFGGRGSGPGEFRMPVYLGETRSGYWIEDRSLNRISLFDRELGFLRVLSPMSGPSHENIRVAGILGDSTVLGLPSVPRSSRSGLRATQGSILVGRPKAWKIVGAIRVAEENVNVPLPGGRSAILQHPIDGSERVVPLPGGSGFVFVGSYSPGAILVRWFDSEGTLQNEKEIPIPASRIDRGEREWILARLASRIDDTQVARLVRTLREHLPLPEEYPGIASVVVRSDGALLVRRGVLPWLGVGDEERTITWYWVDPMEGITGQLNLPYGFHVHAWDHEQLIVVSEGELGVPVIRGFQVRTPGESGTQTR